MMPWGSKKTVLLAGLLGVLVCAGFGLHHYMRYREKHPRTEDAYVHAPIVQIAAQVMGPIQSLAVAPYESVKRGQLLLIIDPAPFRLAVAEAQAHVDQAMQRHGSGGGAAHDSAVRAAKVALRKAQLDLAHTKIYAPAAGQIANLRLREGAVVAIGQPLFALIETGEWWVMAHFKETQMAWIRPGQPAEVHVDILPDVTFTGRVAAVSRGSGNSFSLLPAENATGNWVKVTQRFSVQIALLSPTDQKQFLRDGASAEVVVHAE